MLKRNDIIERVAQKGYTKKDASLIIDDLLRVIAEALVEGEDVKFHGFGTFCAKDIKPRQAMDMRTKEMITIPGHKAPKFLPGAPLKRWVREGVIRD